MGQQQFILQQQGGAVKSTPLSKLPPEAWRSLQEAFTADSELLKRYDDTPWFRRGVDVRCDAVADLPFAFVNIASDEALDEGELPEPLLKHGIEFEGMLNTVESWLTLYGQAYVFKAINRWGFVKDLKLMHPATITPKYDPAQGLTGFERRLSGQTITLTEQECVYIWLPSRRSEIGPGSAPAKAALTAAMLLRSGDDFTVLYYENGVIAPTIVTVPEGTAEAEKRRLEGWVQRAMSGLKKAFNVLALSEDVKVSSLGQQLPLGSLALPEMTDKKREDIATAFGVPQSILFSNAANFAVSESDNLHFYDKTVIPEARRIERALNRQLFGPLGWRLRFRPESLEMYQRLQAARAEKLALLFDRDVMTREEVREDIGLETEPKVGKFKSDIRNEHSLALVAARPAQVQLPVPQPPQQEVKVQRDPVGDELGRWQRKALKRIEEGRAEQAAEFESNVLGWGVKTWLTAALKRATNKADVERAFAGAMEWEAYP
jgi:HK97 family phage portal protein